MNDLVAREITDNSDILCLNSHVQKGVTHSSSVLILLFFPCHIILSAWRNLKRNEILVFKDFHATMTTLLIDWMFLSCQIPSTV